MLSRSDPWEQSHRTFCLWSEVRTDVWRVPLSLVPPPPLGEGAGVLDGGGVQQAAQRPEVGREGAGRGRGGGRREAQLHLQPAGGAGAPARCCAAVLGDEGSGVQVELVEAGAGEAQVAVAGRRARPGPLRAAGRGLELDRSWGAARARAGVRQGVREGEREAEELLRTRVATQLRQSHRQLRIWSHTEFTSASRLWVHHQSHDRLLLYYNHDHILCLQWTL